MAILGEDVYLLTWIRHFRRSADHFDVHIFLTERMSSGVALLTDCYLLRDQEVPQHTDDCVGLISATEAWDRLSVRRTQWESY